MQNDVRNLTNNSTVVVLKTSTIPRTVDTFPRCWWKDGRELLPFHSPTLPHTPHIPLFPHHTAPTFEAKYINVSVYLITSLY